MEGLFPKEEYPDLLVGLGEPDDAAVWKLDKDRVLIATTDFFTPVVDDPYDYGAISAANSLSDIYAMGGSPFLALNIAAFPPDLPPEVSSEILRGGAEKAKEAGVVIAGGHTIQDKEPKYGLICLGFAHPDLITTKSAAKPGDALVLTKPLGFGVTTTAIKNQKAKPEHIQEVVIWMKRLNKKASELIRAFGVKAVTDITGFSLLGHAWEMASSSKVGLNIHWDMIPFISSAKEYANLYSFPGGAFDNKLFFEEHVQFSKSLTEEEKLLLFDPQTSGGLLFSIDCNQLDNLMLKAEKMDQPAWVIGEVVEGNQISIQ
ncbi:MAG: selenide, water dikinase SelD [Anaerolineales bacterium]|nr:selenide, water dikinase SelD [Anaerolineales bacterium]